MDKKSNFSKKILKILSEKSAISLAELTKKALPTDLTLRQAQGGRYAVTRSLKGLKEAGLIENVSSGQNDYARLTREGKKKANSLKLESESSILDPRWDGKWRIILLDLPESRKNERESLRYLLKKAGFVLLKNSAWISPYPFEHLFENIKKDLGLTSELMIIVTEVIDEETKKILVEIFKK
jgi:DNA-binding transcriptional regulator PaaX